MPQTPIPGQLSLYGDELARRLLDEGMPSGSVLAVVLRFEALRSEWPVHDAWHLEPGERAEPDS